PPGAPPPPRWSHGHAAATDPSGVGQTSWLRKRWVTHLRVGPRDVHGRIWASVTVSCRGVLLMPEAVIVSTARSPIGRAGKGSLVDMRPDDLTAKMVTAALDKVPELDPAEIDDLMLVCGLQGGESGFNMGRAVAVQLGYDHLPGTTITRYCSSSLQTTRMAMHAIRAGEGDVFISAGVETVSRFAKGNSDSLPDTHNPLFADAKQRTADRAEHGAEDWHDPRDDGQLPDVYIAMGQTAENLARNKGISR